MLIIDVPKRALPEDSADIGHLKKDDRILAVCNRADRFQKPARLPDVLERHLATKEVRCDFVRIFREELAHEPYILPRALPGGHKARIVADTAIISETAYQ